MHLGVICTSRLGGPHGIKFRHELGNVTISSIVHSFMNTLYLDTTNVGLLFYGDLLDRIDAEDDIVWLRTS